MANGVATGVAGAFNTATGIFANASGDAASNVATGNFANASGSGSATTGGVQRRAASRS